MKSLGNVRRSFSPWTDPSAVPYIRFENVTKKFGDFVAVDDLSLDIFEREFFSLLGPSGCGKTTLLRMLAGFEEPTAGQIYLDGQPLKGVPPHNRPVNMMFQSYALFPHMSVEQNIAFGLKQAKMDKAAIAERVDQMLKLVKLEAFLGLYLKGLSPAASEALRHFWLDWNAGRALDGSWCALQAHWPELQEHARGWCERLLAGKNISQEVVTFAQERLIFAPNKLA